MASASGSSPDSENELILSARSVIRENYKYLMTELQVSELLDQLYQDHVLEFDDRQRVEHEATDQSKVRRLLDILCYKSALDVVKFISAVRGTQKHVYDKLVETKIEGSPVRFSVTMKERETLVILLKMCAKDFIEVKKDSTLQVVEVQRRMQKEAETCGLPHDVTNDVIIDVIKSVFPNAKVEEWQQQRKKKKRKSKVDGGSKLKGLRWRRVNKPCATDQELAESETHKEPASLPREHLPGTPSGIEKWSTEEVSDWLTRLDLDETIINTFKDEKITGDILKILTQDEIKEICPQVKFGDQKRIIKARDDFLKCSIPARPHRHQQTDTKDNKLETPRAFDQEESRTTLYRKGRYLPSPNKHSGDPLERIQIFCDISERNGAYSEQKFQVLLAQFVAGCLNERSNATLYFGINPDGLIVGLSGDRSEWQERMTESISSFFFPDQIDLVSKCIRPLRFVETVTDESNSGNCQYVVEVDIVPAYKICEEDIFFIKKLKRGHSEPCGAHFFRISNGDVIELTRKEELAKFIANIPKLSANRKQREEERRNKAGESGKNLRVNLQHLLCRGENSLDGDIFPILVTGGMQNNCTVAEMKANFQFMKHLQWNAVLDFDDRCSLFSYLEENEEQVLKVLKVEDFDESYEENLRNKDRLSGMLQDLRTSCHRPWIFVNGYNPEELSPHDVFEWKEKRSEGFKEAVRYLKHDIPRGRAVVVFLLFSKQYDVMLEAADELATKFANQWFTIAPSDEVAEDWQKGLLQKRLVKSKKELIERSVIGLPWEHVNDTIGNILGSVRETVCELPTSNGMFVKLSTKMQNDWSDLEILSARECDNDTVTQEQTDHASKVEEHFYRGGEVDWWNFYYQSHVLERNCFPRLLDTVRDTLEGKMEEADRVECISLYHQPGAGGTTTAKQVLWKLKDKWRCAVIKQITQQTCQQISRFHSYEDGTPKPVLLLFDNADDERVGALRAELDEQAKQASRCLTGNLDRVFYVFLLCIRKTELIEHIGSTYCRLKHELTSNEQHWFRTKYQELEKKYKGNPKHLIGFNILKENFNPEFITKTVKDLLREITEPRERKLLKYVSLLNAYDLGFQSLPASAFNAIMEVNQVAIMLNLQRWELHLSQSLKILLYQFEKRRAPGGQYIRITHNTLSKQILKILIQEDTEESDDFKSRLYNVCSDFIDSEIFNMTYKDNSVEQLLKVVRDVVKRRARSLKNGKPETKFALIIEDILSESKQNIDDAADLLKKIYELSEDVFVGQQLSRLYIHSMNWVKAKDIAKEITDKKPDNSYLWDTYGHAYKEQIKQIYADCMENGTTMNATDACNILDLTFTAIHIFQKEQEVSETEKTTFTNNSGYYQELQVVIIMLDCLSITEGLKDDVLHQVLVNEKQMPKNLSDLFGESRVFQLSQVQTGVNKALTRLEDEHLQLRDDMADDYQKSQQRLSTEMLIKHKETLEHYYGEEKDEVPSNLTDEEACKYRRRRIFRLAGNTFCAIFELRRKMEGKDTLLAIRTMIDRNMKSRYKNIFDEQMLISVNLTLYCIDDRYKKEIVLEEMSKLAAYLYKARDKRIDYSLEPYIFAVMFNWPSKNPDGRRRAIPAQEIPEILKNWRSAYYKKYPRQKEEGRAYRKKETTVFFLGNGEGIASLAFDQELRKEGIKRNSEQFWNLPHVVQRLERWNGVLVKDGSEVKINITQGGNRLSLQIPTSMPIFDRSMWSKTVYYVIGFTWAGPKAFDIRIEHPGVVSRKEETAKSIAKSNPKQTIVRQRDGTQQHPIYHRMAAEFKELASQLALIAKLKRKSKKTREENALCRKEAEIQRHCEHLTEEIRKAYNDLYTDY